MIAKVLISQKERYPVNVYFCFQISRSIYKYKMAAELTYLKAWSLSFDHLVQKIRDFVKNLLLKNISRKRVNSKQRFLFEQISLSSSLPEKNK